MTINGNAKRHNGILQNPLYSGRLVWNRVSMIRDPDTGRRVSRPNPPEERQEARVPELAALEARLAAAPHEKIVVLHPAMLETYRRTFAQLGKDLSDFDPKDEGDAELMAAFRDLIERVVIHDRPDGSVECEVIGCLGPLIREEGGGAWGGEGVSGGASASSPPPPMIWGRFAT